MCSVCVCVCVHVCVCMCSVRVCVCACVVCVCGVCVCACMQVVQYSMKHFKNESRGHCDVKLAKSVEKLIILSLPFNCSKPCMDLAAV